MPHLDLINRKIKNPALFSLESVAVLMGTPTQDAEAKEDDVELRQQTVASRPPVALQHKTPRIRG